MIAFVDLIHALQTREGKYTIDVSRGSFASREGKKKNWEKCICSGGLAFMHLGALFRLNFSCALLPMVSSSFASPW
jgi:hypothetical protein